MGSQVPCPSCGAIMTFDVESQGLVCEYCGSQDQIEIDGKEIVEKDLDSIPISKGWETKVNTFQCDSCGATISTQLNITGECPFCGSNYVKELPPHDDIIRPESLVPFKVSIKEARSLFRKWIGSGWFRPNNLKKLKKMKDIKGIYIPFWTYDCDSHSDWTAQSGYYYYETEHYTTQENGRTVRKTRQVRKTRWQNSSGNRNDNYDDVLILASKGLDMKMAKKIYPFQLGELVHYKPDYLSGWYAEEYSIDVQSGWGQAKAEVESDQRSKCGSDVPGDTHRSLNVMTLLSNMKYKHVLLPIWSASYHYKDTLYQFLINGQTGEVQGEKPWSWIKIALAVGAGVALAALLLYIYFSVS